MSNQATTPCRQFDPEDIPIVTLGEGSEHPRLCISARALYRHLEVELDFNIWLDHLIQNNAYIESIDFLLISNKATAKHEHTDRYEYVFPLDTAKEISLLSQTEKGRLTRAYFAEYLYLSIIEPSKFHMLSRSQRWVAAEEAALHIDQLWPITTRGKSL